MIVVLYLMNSRTGQFEQLCLSLKAHGFRRFVFVARSHLANVYTFASVALN
jgi:hypothetical protein